jgi:hypothetical protein
MLNKYLLQACFNPRTFGNMGDDVFEKRQQDVHVQPRPYSKKSVLIGGLSLADAVYLRHTCTFIHYQH